MSGFSPNFGTPISPVSNTVSMFFIGMIMLLVVVLVIFRKKGDPTLITTTHANADGFHHNRLSSPFGHVVPTYNTFTNNRRRYDNRSAVLRRSFKARPAGGAEKTTANMISSRGAFIVPDVTEAALHSLTYRAMDPSKVLNARPLAKKRTSIVPIFSHVGRAVQVDSRAHKHETFVR